MQDRLQTVGKNLAEQGPGTIALVGVFVLITFFDIFFNVSRGFICAIPGVCDAVDVNVIQQMVDTEDLSLAAAGLVSDFIFK